MKTFPCLFIPKNRLVFKLLIENSFNFCADGADVAAGTFVGDRAAFGARRSGR